MGSTKNFARSIDAPYDLVKHMKRSLPNQKYDQCIELFKAKDYTGLIMVLGVEKIEADLRWEEIKKRINGSPLPLHKQWQNSNQFHRATSRCVSINKALRALIQHLRKLKNYDDEVLEVLCTML